MSSSAAAAAAASPPESDEDIVATAMAGAVWLNAKDDLPYALVLSAVTESVKACSASSGIAHKKVVAQQTVDAMRSRLVSAPAGRRSTTTLNGASAWDDWEMVPSLDATGLAPSDSKAASLATADFIAASGPATALDLKDSKMGMTEPKPRHEVNKETRAASAAGSSCGSDEPPQRTKTASGAGASENDPANDRPVKRQRTGDKDADSQMQTQDVVTQEQSKNTLNLRYDNELPCVYVLDPPPAKNLDVKITLGGFGATVCLSDFDAKTLTVGQIGSLSECRVCIASGTIETGQLHTFGNLELCITECVLKAKPDARVSGEVTVKVCRDMTFPSDNAKPGVSMTVIRVYKVSSSHSISFEELAKDASSSLPRTEHHHFADAGGRAQARAGTPIRPIAVRPVEADPFGSSWASGAFLCLKALLSETAAYELVALAVRASSFDVVCLRPDRADLIRRLDALQRDSSKNQEFTPAGVKNAVRVLLATVNNDEMLRHTFDSLSSHGFRLRIWSEDGATLRFQPADETSDAIKAVALDCFTEFLSSEIMSPWPSLRSIVKDGKTAELALWLKAIRASSLWKKDKTDKKDACVKEGLVMLKSTVSCFVSRLKERFGRPPSMSDPSVLSEMAELDDRVQALREVAQFLTTATNPPHTFSASCEILRQFLTDDGARYAPASFSLKDDGASDPKNFENYHRTKIERYGCLLVEELLCELCSPAPATAASAKKEECIAVCATNWAIAETNVSWWALPELSYNEALGAAKKAIRCCAPSVDAWSKISAAKTAAFHMMESCIELAARAVGDAASRLAAAEACCSAVLAKTRATIRAAQGRIEAASKNASIAMSTAFDLVRAAKDEEFRANERAASALAAVKATSNPELAKAVFAKAPCDRVTVNAVVRAATLATIIPSEHRSAQVTVEALVRAASTRAARVAVEAATKAINAEAQSALADVFAKETATQRAAEAERTAANKAWYSALSDHRDASDLKRQYDQRRRPVDLGLSKTGSCEQTNKAKDEQKVNDLPAGGLSAGANAHANFSSVLHEFPASSVGAAAAECAVHELMGE